MKTLKHLALMALVCFGASAFAYHAAVSDLKKQYKIAEDYKKKGMNKEARTVTQSIIDQSNELLADQSLTEAEVNKIVEVMTDAQNMQYNLPTSYTN